MGSPVEPERVAEVLLEIVRFYARLRPGVVDILEASGQERFKISIKSLRRAAGKMGVYGVDVLIDAALRDDSVRRALEERGVRVIVGGRGEVWVEVPAGMLIEFRREAVGRGPAGDEGSGGARRGSSEGAGR